MTKYNINLNDKKKLSLNIIFSRDAVIVYLIIIILLLSSVLLIKKTRHIEHNKINIKEKEHPFVKDQIIKNQNNFNNNSNIKDINVMQQEKKATTSANNNKIVIKHNFEKKTHPKNRYLINTKFTSQLNGYKIVGVAVARNIRSVVYLSNKNDSKTLFVGDYFQGYKIESIHRTYILLSKNNKKIHLNYIN